MVHGVAALVTSALRFSGDEGASQRVVSVACVSLAPESGLSHRLFAFPILNQPTQVDLTPAVAG